MTLRPTALLLVVLVLPWPLPAQWTESPGEGWVHAALYHHDTRRQFWMDGGRIRIPNEGHAVATSLYLTTAVGLVPGVDAWVQIPFHRLAFSDLAGRRVRSGAGDARVFLRWAPARTLGSAFPLAVRGGLKLPLGDFPLDAEIIPLGEGQRDWELMVELGRSFHPRPAYVMGWVGYRWREEDRDRARDFGDEAFFFAAAGGDVGPLAWKLALEGWRGRTPVFLGIPVRSARREMLQVAPTVSAGWGPGSVEGGVRLPLAGRNLPSGPALVVGYFARWRRSGG